MGSGGHTTAESYLPLDGALVGGSVPNYDVDRDSEPGLLIQKGDGLSETDETKMQRWWGQLGEATPIRGVPVLDVWVATKDFDTGKTGRVVAGIYDCANNMTDCNLLASGASRFSQSAFGAGFGKVVLVMPAVDVTIAADRGILLKIGVPNDSDDDLWLAYGATAQPMRLSLNN